MYTTYIFGLVKKDVLYYHWSNGNEINVINHVFIFAFIFPYSIPRSLTQNILLVSGSRILTQSFMISHIARNWITSWPTILPPLPSVLLPLLTPSPFRLFFSFPLPTLPFTPSGFNMIDPSVPYNCSFHRYCKVKRRQYSVWNLTCR